MPLPLNIYEQQKSNIAKTRLILAGFVLFLVFLGLGADAFLYGSGVGLGIPVCTIGAALLGGFSAWWALQGGDKAVLESTHAVPVDLSDPRQRMLDDVVSEMAIAGGLPKPAVYVIPDPDPNAFATGVGPVTFDQSYAVTATPVAVSVDIFYARGVAAILAPVDGFPGDVYQLTAYVPTYAEIAEALPALASFKYPPQVGVILRIAGRASQNGLAISIAQ